MKYICFVFVILFVSCKDIDLQDNSRSEIKTKSFNLKTLKSFVKKKINTENKRSGNSLKKIASVSGTQEFSYDDILLWEYAIKEVVSHENYSYNVPVKVSLMKDKLESYLPEKGYQALNFYTDATYDNVYARLREYRPDPIYIDSLCLAKNITLSNYNYLDYYNVLEGEKFDGYIVVYNLDNTPFKLIQVKKGIVNNVKMYSNNL